MALDGEEEFNSVVWDAAGGDDIGQLIQALTTHGHLIDTPHPKIKGSVGWGRLSRISTPLHRAAEQGNVSAIETLIRFGSKALNSNKWTPLHSAAESGHVRAIEALFRLGCKIMPDSRTVIQEWTPFHLAAEKGHADAIEALFLLTKDINIRITYGLGNTPMGLATENGHVAAIEVIGRYDPLSVDELGDDDVPPIYTAVQKGHVEAVRALIRLGSKEIGPIDDTHCAGTDSEGYTPLLSAAAYGHFEIVKLLVRYGSLQVLHIQDKEEFLTPLGYAVKHGHLEIARFLKSLYRQPLAAAALEDRDEDPSDDESEKWAKKDIAITEDEVLVNRYLAYFAYSLSEHLFFELERLSHLKVLQAMNKLWTAAKNGDINQVSEALAAHSDLIDSPMSEERRTLMQFAANTGNVQLIETLVRFGSQAIDTPDDNGHTPIHLAVIHEQPAAIEALVRHGSQALDRPDRRSYTPLDLAGAHYQSCCASVLKALGARSTKPVDIKMTEEEVLQLRFRVYLAQSLADRLLYALPAIRSCPMQRLLLCKS